MNWKVRFKNPVFVCQLILSVLLPVLTYAGMQWQDVTSWSVLGELLLGAIKNPYVLFMVAVAAWNAVNDPTTEGVKDSKQALTYEVPKKFE